MQRIDEERASIDKLVRDHYALVYKFCVRRIGKDRAEDAAQETFLTVQKVLPKFRGDSSVTSWILGIAHNECRRVCRKEKLEPCTLQIDVPYHGIGERDMVDREALRIAMESLSPEHREVIYLHELEGLTYEEAALILNVPPGTVKSRIHHAFQNLRRALYPLGLEA